MSKISIPFLVGFAVVSCVGVASAQGLPDAQNSVGAHVMSMESTKANVKLGAKASGPLTDAASSLMSSQAIAGVAVDIPTVNAKIGGGTDFNLPTNALTDQTRGNSTNMVNSLQPSSDTDGLKADIVLGANGGVSNMISDEFRNNLRLRK